MTKFISDRQNKGLPVRAALYVRVSTGPQAKRDLSIPSQITLLNAYCAKKGWQVVATYKDARSGTNDRRPEFQMMLDRAKDGTSAFDVILVHSFSRFYREEIECELEIRGLRKRKVDVVSITQDLPPGDHGDILRRFMNILDEWNSKETAKHVSRTRRTNAEQGFFCGGPAPFGYRSVDAGVIGNTAKRRLAIREDEAEVVKLIYHLYLVGDGASGRKGVKLITSHLNERKVLYRGTRRWGTGDVHRVLTDPIYMGQYVYYRRSEPDRQILTGVPSIISAGTFEDAQATLRSNDPRVLPPRTVSGPTLLSGLAKCGYCGAAMTIRTGKSGRYRYYTCSRSMRQGSEGCCGLSVPMQKLDEVVKAEISAIFLSAKRVATIAREAQQAMAAHKEEESDEDSSRKVRLAEAQYARLLDLLTQGIADPSNPIVKAKLSAAEAELKALKATACNRRSPRPENGGAFNSIAEAVCKEFQSGSSGFDRAYLRAVLSQIEVRPDRITIFRKPPETERLAFRRRNGTETPEQVLITCRFPTAP